MSEQSLERAERESKELEKLEAAAQQCSSPEEIEQQAALSDAKTQTQSPHFWFIPYLAAAAIAGLLLLVLEWEPRLFKPALVSKIHRYLLGVGAIILVLGVTKAVDIYAIGRLRNPVSLFNLR